LAVAAGNTGQSGLRHDLVFDKTRLCGSARAITGLMFYLILCLLLIFTAWTGVAKAAVDRLEILERHLVAEGAAFGASGAYEKIRGRAWFALDPHAAANAAIADLVLAPPDVRGLVTFGAEFLMPRPAEPARGNGTVLYEVNNRGNIAILAEWGSSDPLDRYPEAGNCSDHRCAGKSAPTRTNTRNPCLSSAELNVRIHSAPAKGQSNFG